MSDRPELSVVVPALNEAENLRTFLPLLREALAKRNEGFEILVINDGAPDGTGEVCRENGVALHEQQGPGYGGALRTGFREARGKYILTLDADLSHSPVFIGPMLEAAAQSDIVIASRYVPGGTAEMSAVRLALSRVLNALFRLVFSFPIRDMSSGFRLYRADILREMSFSATNFDILQEILIRSFAKGYRIREIPFHYAFRSSGRSHARLLAFGWSYLKTFFRMWRLRKLK